MSTGFPSGRRITSWLKSGISSAKRTLTSCRRADEHDIAGLEPGFRRRRPFDRAADERATLDVRRLQQRLHVEPDPASLDPAVLDDRDRDFLREIRGNRAGQAHADLVDADDLPVHVDERPAGVAAEDRGVVTDPADDRSDILAFERHAVERPEQLRHDHLGVADDAHRHRLRERERAAERQHPIADLQRRGVAEARRRETAAAVAGLSLRTAMSDSGSVPTSSAGISSRVGSVQTIAFVLPGDVVVRDDVPFRR